MALSSSGTVAAWGRNTESQCNVPAGLANVISIAAGAKHSLALRANGSVTNWGAYWDGVTSYGPVSIPSSFTNITAIACGDDHDLFLTANGHVLANGLDLNGETDVPSDLSNVVAIAAGGETSAALTSSGRLVMWGRNNYGQTDIPTGASTPLAFAVGFAHALAVRTNKTVAAWGQNVSGQTAVPFGLTNAVAAFAGYEYSAVLVDAGAAQNPLVSRRISLNPESNSVRIFFQTTSGRSFSLEKATTWPPISWLGVTNGTGTGATFQFLDATAGGLGYYRLKEF
jgi:alpha-tubulin suppressor-like RCC1 family protein